MDNKITVRRVYPDSECVRVTGGFQVSCNNRTRNNANQTFPIHASEDGAWEIAATLIGQGVGPSPRRFIP